MAPEKQQWKLTFGLHIYTNRPNLPNYILQKVREDYENLKWQKTHKLLDTTWIGFHLIYFS